MSKSKKSGNPTETHASPNDVPQRVNLKLVLGCCFGLLVLTLGTYVYSMTSEYVFNDSINYLVTNGLKDRSMFWYELVLSGLTSPLSLPWLKATFAWDMASFGFTPGWSHAVNICLHVLSVIYFYIFAFRVSMRMKLDGRTNIDPNYVAVAAAALVACHPLMTGSIAYVSGRSGVLGAANFFLALDFFLCGFYEEHLLKSAIGYLGFFLFAVIGLLSNLECLTLPLLALALIGILKPAAVKAKDYLTDRSYEMILLLMLAVGLCFLFRYGVPAQTDASIGMTKLGSVAYCATQFKMILMYYLRSVVAPFGLCVYPPYVASNWSDPGTVGGALAVVALGAAGLVQKQPLIRVGTAIFLFTLLPWVLLPQGEIASDARFYLPLTGLCLIGGVGLAHLAMRDFRKTAIGFAALLLAFIALNISRQGEWSSNLRLWTAEVQRVPGNSRVHSNYAAALVDANKSPENKTELDAALKRDPDDYMAHLASAYYYFKLKQNDNAVLELQKAVDLGVKYGMTEEELSQYRSQLARAYLLNNDMPNAYKQARLANQYITTDGVLDLIIGKQLLAEGNTVQALRVLEEGVKLDPTNAEFLVPIAEAALDSGLPQVLQHAYAASKRATQVRPSFKASKLYIRACLEFNKLDDGRPLLNQLRLTDPKDADLMWLEAGYEQQSGHAEKAKALRAMALAADSTVAKRLKLYLRKPGTNSVLPMPAAADPSSSTQHVGTSVPADSSNESGSAAPVAPSKESGTASPAATSKESKSVAASSNDSGTASPATSSKK